MRKVVLLPALAFMLLMLTSCWNYREVNDLAIVIGAAIDKGMTENYLLTVELLEVGGGQDTEVTSKALSVEGETVFDAVRKLISIERKRGYWGHIRALIVSEEIAAEDLTQVIRFFRQDAETSGDLHIIISKGCRAEDILHADIPHGTDISTSLAQCLESSRFLSKSPSTPLFKLSQELKSLISPTLPVVTLIKLKDMTIPVLSGAAVFHNKKLAGYLDGEETKAMLFLKDEIKGGVLVTRKDPALLSLEILENNTKIKTRNDGKQLALDITVETKAAINEVTCNIEFSDPTVFDEIQRLAEEQLGKKLEDVIDKARSLRADIFGFGQKIYENNPRKWAEISGNYDEEFTNIRVNIDVNVDIVNTSIIYKQFE